MSFEPLNQSLLDSSSIAGDILVDIPKRVEYSQSWWQSLLHFREKKSLDNKIEHEVMSLFQQRYNFKDHNAFRRVWNAIHLSQIWDKDTTLTVDLLRKINTQLQENLLYHGPGIRPPKRNKITTDKVVHRVVNSLLHGHALPRSVIERRTLQAVLVEHNPELSKKFFDELQNELNSLLENPPKNKKEELLWRTFLGNVIAFIPFTYPAHETMITIPTLENGICRPVAYQIDVMPLELSEHTTPMSVLGLTPIGDDKATPILSFIGTTYPAADGFATTVLADFTPNKSVGEAVYEKNHAQIDAWMQGKKNVHVIGISLGGAMTFHTLRHHHEKISRVDVYNPPGLYPELWDKEIDFDCEINIYCQPGDLVSELGAWPTQKNVSLYLVMQHHKGLSENIFSSHARAFSGCKDVSIVKQDPAVENSSWRRKFLTKIHQWLGPFVVYLPVSFSLWLYRIARTISRAVSHIFNKRHND